MDVLKDHGMEAGRASFPLLAYFVTLGKFIPLYEPSFPHMHCENFACIQCFPKGVPKAL